MLIKSHHWRDGIEAMFSKGCFGKPALIVALGMLFMTSACVAARQVPRVESETLSPPAATATSLRSATVSASLPASSKNHETPSATLSEPEEHVTTSASSGWLLIASRHGYLRTLDLASGEFVARFSNVIDWRHGASIKLDERIGSQTWVALRKSYKLFIYGLVEEEPLHELQLFNGAQWMDEAGPNAYPFDQIYAIHGAWAPPIWSPTSPVLAYNAALEGNWVQVYTFDVETNTHIKVTPEGEHAVALSWSPDGRYLVYAIVSKFERDGYIADEIGVMDFESGFEVMRVRKYSRNPLEVIGWLSDTEMLVAEQLPLAGYSHLDLLDVESGTIQFLNNSTFYDADFSTRSRLILTTENRRSRLGELVFIQIGEAQTRSTRSFQLDVEVGAVQWIPGVDLFSVETQEGTLLIDDAGEIISRFPAESGSPLLSPDGSMFAFGPSQAFYDGVLRIYSISGDLLFKSDLAARDIEWWPDSKGVFFVTRGEGIAAVELQRASIMKLHTGEYFDASLITEKEFAASQVLAAYEPMPTASPSPPATALTPGPTAQALLDTVLGPGINVTISDLQMINSQVGWGLGQAPGDRFERLLYTSDGGDTWRDATPPKDPAPSHEELRSYYGFRVQPAAFYAFDERVAWISYAFQNSSSWVVVWRTEDAGRTWKKSEPIDMNMIREHGIWVSGFWPIEMDFSDSMTGWLLAITEIPALASGAENVMLRTHDGGKHWYFTSGSFTYGTGDMVFIDRFNGWINDVGIYPDYNSFMVTRDGGEYWFDSPEVNVGQPPSDLNPEGGCESGHQLEKLPGGAIKFVLYCPSRSDPYSSEFERESFLWVSDDNGVTWEESPLPVAGVPGEEFSTSFISTEVGWLLDFQTGWLYQTPDGGDTWRKIKRIAWQGRLYFVDHLHGWAFAKEVDGEGNTVSSAFVGTLDGGYTWEILSPAIE